MFNKKAKSNEIEALDISIEQIQLALNNMNPDTKEWLDTQKLCMELLKERQKYITSNDSNKAHFKDWIPVIASLGGIMVIVTFEAFGHSMTSKASGLLAKPKI